VKKLRTDTQQLRSNLYFLPIILDSRVSHIAKCRNSCRLRIYLLEQFESLRLQVDDERTQSGKVPTWMRQACHNEKRFADCRHDNRYR
jgi:hypothetical protein